MSKPRWIRVSELSAFAPGSVKPHKAEGFNLAVIRSDDAEVHVVDNRCPHEGYPLIQGDLKGCVLTCAWHNWKFDVRDGSCILGGEAVRAYPTRVVDGALEVDVADPDPAELLPRLKTSLDEGIYKRDRGRAIRDATRMLQAGYSPRQVLADLAAYDGTHAEFGTTHVLPMAADAARLLPRYSGVEAMFPIAQVIDMCAENNLRLPARPVPDPISGGSESALRDAVEAEETERAQALLCGAIRDGFAVETIEQWLYSLTSLHFTDFGHQLIYLVKAQELLRGLDPRVAGPIYGGLLYSICLATREDTLPYMRTYFRSLAKLEDELEDLYRNANDETAIDSSAIREAVLDGTPQDAVDSIWQALRRGQSPLRIAEALVEAAAHRLYRFDLHVERDPDVQEAWLFATHRLTFASAVRNAVKRFPSPNALRFLIQAVAFIHSGRPMDAPAERRFTAAPPKTSNVTVAQIAEEVVARRPEAAVGALQAYLGAGAPVPPLADRLLDICLGDPLVRPIFVAHALKTIVAAFEEREALGESTEGDVPVWAAVRFLASPVIERRVHDEVRESLRWLVEGITPRKLTQ